MAVKCIKEHVILVSFYKQNLPRFIIMSLVWAALYTVYFFFNKSYSFTNQDFPQKTALLGLYYGFNVMTIMYVKKMAALNSICKKKLLNFITASIVSLEIYSVIWYASLFMSFILLFCADALGITNHISLLFVKFLPIAAAVFFLQHIYDAVLCIKNSSGLKSFVSHYVSVYSKISLLPIVCFFLAIVKMLLLYYRFREVSSLIIIILVEVLYFFASAAMLFRYASLDEERIAIR